MRKREIVMTTRRKQRRNEDETSRPSFQIRFPLLLLQFFRLFCFFPSFLLSISLFWNHIFPLFVQFSSFSQLSRALISHFALSCLLCIFFFFLLARSSVLLLLNPSSLLFFCATHSVLLYLSQFTWFLNSLSRSHRSSVCQVFSNSLCLFFYSPRFCACLTHMFSQLSYLFLISLLSVKSWQTWNRLLGWQKGASTT